MNYFPLFAFWVVMAVCFATLYFSRKNRVEKLTSQLSVEKTFRQIDNAAYENVVSVYRDHVERLSVDLKFKNETIQTLQETVATWENTDQTYKKLVATLEERCDNLNQEISRLTTRNFELYEQNKLYARRMHNEIG